MTPSSPTSTVDSLFDEVEDDGSFDGEYAEPQPDLSTIVPARRTPPPIPGLYVFPALLPADLASEYSRATYRQISGLV
jgi:hypothetical protein